MSEHVRPAPDTPELVVKTQGSVRSLHPGPSYSLGRDPACDIAISDSRVSWHHADLRLERDLWVLEDTGSTNGTYLGPDRRQRVEIDAGCELRLGDPETGPLVACELVPAPEPGPAAGTARAWPPPGTGARRPPTAVMRAPAQVMRIGRAPDNDLVIADLGVSRHHAQLRHTGGGRYEIVDLGSHNGTFVNGQRVSAAPMTEQDVVAIGRATFRLAGDELR